MSWLQKLLLNKVRVFSTEKKGVPEGLWSKCPACSSTLYSAELERNLSVCPRCDYHMRITARKRLFNYFLDADNREELATEVEPLDRLKFRDIKKYKDRIEIAQKTTGEKCAVIAVRGYVCGVPIVAVAFDFFFIGGSLGAAEGEKFVAAVDEAIAKRIPLVCFTASGGARMQEGMISLLQMSKTSAALAKLSAQNLPYVVVLTDPTTGGVSASLASLGDIILAEPKAVVGFAGRRVIEQTIRQQLPEVFQTSEFVLQHGAIDNIVPRKELRIKIAKILAKFTHQPIPHG